MDWINNLNGLGLPAWLISVAAFIFVLDRVGLLIALRDFITKNQSHDLKMEEDNQRYRNLQDSWQAERFADFLSNSIEFLQVQITKRLDGFDERMDKQDRTTGQVRDTLTTVYRELSHIRELVSNRETTDKIATRNGADD